MGKLVPAHKVYISASAIANAGRGVFAAADIEKDEVFEVCPVLVIPKNDTVKLIGCILEDYYFYWGEKAEWGLDPTKRAVALGFGSLYNHSYRPNATYTRDLDSKTITFKALKKIKKDEEITVSYNFGDPEILTPVRQKGIPPYSGETG